MSRTIEVKAKSGSYEVRVGRDLLKEVPAYMKEMKEMPPGTNVFVIGDTHTHMFVEQLDHFLINAGYQTRTATIIAGEGSKNLETVRQLYSACADANLDRRSVIIAVGGGVVGDVAGFVAATYLRGLRFIQVPTTVVGQVDASIGGKTGVDLQEGKNLVGAFHQPSLVVCDLDLMESLPQREFNSGLAEIIKYGLIADEKLFMDLEKRLSHKPVTLDSEVVVRCAQIKAEVVSADERETMGLRAILNFGHTIGHAIETVAGYGKILHGEAVAIGMVASAMLSHDRLQFPGRDVKRIHDLLAGVELPVKIPRPLQTPVAIKKLIKTMFLDKKTRDGKLQFVLLEKIGKPKTGQEVSPDDVQKVLERLF
jgi:3-dehydroquinate synthase